MKPILRWLTIREIIAANMLGAWGDTWAQSAARRLRKLSGTDSNEHQAH